MARRKRRPNRGRISRSRAGNAPDTGQKRAHVQPKSEQSSDTGQAETASEANKPQGEWVAVEHRDPDGNPTFPKELIAGTYARQCQDVPHGTEIKVLVLAGYKPNALLLVERKIYEIHRLAIRGWRRTGQITLEMDAWRQHESDWFNAMRGVRLEVSDPGLPGPHNEKSQYIVTESSFHRKIVNLLGENGNKTEVRMYEGTLDISETWKSAWQRQAAEVLNMGFKYLLLPLLSALVAGLAVWWIIDRSPTSDLHDSPTPGSGAEHPVQSGTDETRSDRPNKPVSQRNSGESVEPNSRKRREVFENAPMDEFTVERATGSSNETGTQRSHSDPEVEPDTSGLPDSPSVRQY